MNGIETLICECCGEWFRTPYINDRFCALCCGSHSDCMPGRCALPDNLPRDPVVAACYPLPGEAAP